MAKALLDFDERHELLIAAKSLKGTTLHTDGRGLWSSESKPVVIKRITVHEIFGTNIPAETFLKVYPTKESWDVDEDGLIYTDRTWLSELRSSLKQAGFAKADLVNYTEQGMQGHDYVHLIVGSW